MTSIVGRLLRGVRRQKSRRRPYGSRLMARVVRNTLMRWAGRADYGRWSTPQALEEWWDERTRALASFVPAGSNVIEFGAGRRQLERFLPNGCTYTPSDLVERGTGTIVCDLNRRPLPNLSHVTPQVGVFGGVLEYIRDVAAIAKWLADSRIHICVLSFDPAPGKMSIFGRLRELRRRAYYGYMNGLTENELQRAFEAAGYTCTQKQKWTTHVILQLRIRS